MKKPNRAVRVNVLAREESFSAITKPLKRTWIKVAPSKEERRRRKKRFVALRDLFDTRRVNCATPRFSYSNFGAAGYTSPVHYRENRYPRTSSTLRDRTALSKSVSV